MRSGAVANGSPSAYRAVLTGVSMTSERVRRTVTSGWRTWRPENTDLSSDCGGPDTLSLREVLSNGSGDTYHQYRTGQAFRIANLPDGDYYISIEANPDDNRDGRNLVEGDYTNNDSLRKITIGTNKRTGKRWVKAEQVGMVIEKMPNFF